ncbi:arginine vasopressin-induced protein 1 [Astyanax mexicanus]|uniref:Arginine vasopressin-induced protein 1 n=1 Tax=Astyanax mexicanus TaxID=7994 RepID=A0A8T2KYA8_ASTMX|nr:arginine vasopressin-induced protein 1 [Astyanax mexicanus]
MEEVAAAPPALPGPSQPTFCRPAASERRSRKSGAANIFQGVNLRQLRRLFRSAGEPDAEQRARMVWGDWTAGAAEGEDGGQDEEEGEDEDRLAQALVGLRVRARNRSGIRAEPHRSDGVSATRGVRAFGHSRFSERSPGQSSEAAADEDDAAAAGACGGQDPVTAGSCDSGDVLYEEEEVRGSWSRSGAVEKDPERYLHRIRH